MVEARERWTRIVREWRKSGLGVRAFCRKHGVPEYVHVRATKARLPRLQGISAHTYVYKRHVVLSDALPLDRLHAIQDKAAKDRQEFIAGEE